MANRDAPHGFLPVRGPFRVNEYQLAAANTICGVGDIIVKTSAGLVDVAAAAPSADLIVGVAMESAAASSGKKIRVSDHPDTIYQAQTDNGTGTLTAQTGINLNADIIATAATNGQSNMEIDEDSGNTTATLPVRIIGLHRAQGLEANAFGEFNVLECVLNINERVGV